MVWTESIFQLRLFTVILRANFVICERFISLYSVSWKNIVKREIKEKWNRSGSPQGQWGVTKNIDQELLASKLSWKNKPHENH